MMEMGGEGALPQGTIITHIELNIKHYGPESYIGSFECNANGTQC
jgi:hypothetical protein